MIRNLDLVALAVNERSSSWNLFLISVSFSEISSFSSLQLLSF